jgi:hypothetical protein
MPPSRIPVKLWLALGTAIVLPASAALAAEPRCDPQEVLEAARLDRASSGGGGEAGESGAAPETRLAMGLVSLAADLAAGDAALAAGEPETASILFGFALDEGYHRIAQPLREAGQPGFEPALAALERASANRDPGFSAAREKARAGLDAALGAVPDAKTPRGALDAGVELVNRAARDFQLAVACGRIGDPLAAWQARAAASLGLDALRRAAASLGAKDPASTAAMLREAEALLAMLPSHPIGNAPAADAGIVTATSSRVLLAAGELMR